MNRKKAPKKQPAPKLTPRQKRFVASYLICPVASKAAMAAGYPACSARQRGYDLLRKPIVADAIKKGMEERAQNMKVDAAWVLEQWLMIAKADPRELVQYVREPCERCWGGKTREEIDPDCPECKGRGRGHVVLADTRHLSPEAAALYSGVQLGKDGIKVNMADREAALANIAKHLGMFPTKVELTGADGGPIQSVNTVTDDPVKAAEIYQKVMAGSG